MLCKHASKSCSHIDDEEKETERHVGSGNLNFCWNQGRYIYQRICILLHLSIGLGKRELKRMLVTARCVCVCVSVWHTLAGNLLWDTLPEDHLKMMEVDLPIFKFRVRSQAYFILYPSYATADHYILLYFYIYIHIYSNGNLSYPPKATPPRNKALLRNY